MEAFLNKDIQRNKRKKDLEAKQLRDKPKRYRTRHKTVKFNRKEVQDELE